MSYHKKQLAPGTPPEAWIRENVRVNDATARGYASGISFLIEEYGLSRVLTEDVCDIRDLDHVGSGYSWRRTWNRKLQTILRRYQRSLHESQAAGGATV